MLVKINGEDHIIGFHYVRCPLGEAPKNKREADVERSYIIQKFFEGKLPPYNKDMHPFASICYIKKQATGEMLAAAVSICIEEDNFSRKVGRTKSYNSLLKILNIDADKLEIINK
jgi:hypothetical protein